MKLMLKTPLQRSVIKAVSAAILLGWIVPLAAQIQLTPGKGMSTMNTINMEPRAVQTLDGVSTHYYASGSPGIEGSPYLDEQFEAGVLTIRDGTVIPGLRFRYNIFNDRMQFLLNGDTSEINKPLSVRSVEMENGKFVYDVYLAGANRVATSYFQVIAETESMSILMRHRIELKQDVYVPNYGGGGGTKEFIMIKKDTYYVKFGDGAAQLIKKKKDFLKAFPVLRDQVKSYMKSNHLSVRKESDLKKLAEFYNNMVFSNY